MKMQKALHLHLQEDKVRQDHLKKDYFIFEKYDGWYGYLDEKDRGVRSSSGRLIPSMKNLSSEISKIHQGRLIFEIIIPGIPFAITNGILNRKSEQAEDAILMVHDWVVDCSEPFYKRYNKLASLVNVIDNPRVMLAPIVMTSQNPLVWKAEAETMWNKGKEGVILKRTLAPYSPGKRNYDLMKIKEEVTVDLLVVGVEVGKGKYSDTLGKLVLIDSKGVHHKVSGMTDFERTIWWNRPGDIIGSVIEVKAMKKLPDGQLREPRFTHIRHDKSANQID